MKDDLPESVALFELAERLLHLLERVGRRGAAAWRRPRRWLAFWPASYCSLADLLLLG